jgi:hypothetical protein
MLGAPESSLPFHDDLKPKKSNPVNGKPQTMATIPATNERHFTKPNTKSTTAQVEKKTSGVRRFIASIIGSPRHNLGDSNRHRPGEDECNGDFATVSKKPHGLRI